MRLVPLPTASRQLLKSVPLALIRFSWALQKMGLYSMGRQASAYGACMVRLCLLVRFVLLGAGIALIVIRAFWFLGGQFSGEKFSSAHQICSDEKRQGIVSHLSSSARIQLAIHAAIWLARSAAALAAQVRAWHQALWLDAGRIWVLGVCWPVRRRFLKAENSQARMASTKV